jgi:DNA-binding response OmpR family regulator
VATLRVLVAEDDPEIGQLLDIVLSGFGHAVTVTATGDAARAAFEGGRYDVGLFDVMMPGTLDGFGLVEHVRSAGSDLPVILLTARTTEDDHQRGFAAGADAYVTKPFVPRQLLATIDELVAMSPLRRQQRRAEELERASFLRSLEHRF